MRCHVPQDVFLVLQIPPVCTASARIMGVRTEEKVTPEDFSVTPTADSSVIHFLVPDSYHGHYNVALTANNTAGTNIYWFSVALTLSKLLHLCAAFLLQHKVVYSKT